MALSKNTFVAPFMNQLVLLIRLALFIFCITLISCGTDSSADKHIVTIKKIDTLEFNLTSKEKLLASRIDSFYQKAHHAGTYNGCVLVSVNNRVIYKNALGWGNKQKAIPLSLQTKFELASVSKQFTAVAIMKLKEDGKLNFNDSIQKFIPSFPYRPLTIENLLAHRSGLSNYTSFCSNYFKKYDSLIANQDVVNCMVKHRPDPYNRPNRQFSYCNTNYVLLAYIVEQISGKSFDKYMQEDVFEPLGMINTYIKNKHEKFTTQEALGYTTRYTPCGVDMYDGCFGDKGVFSTVEDLYRWDNMLRGNGFLSDSTLKKAFTPYSNEKKGKRNYGFGFRMITDDTNTPRIIYHNGWWHGFRTLFYKNLDNDITIVSLSNTTGRFVYNIKPIVEIITGNCINPQQEDEGAD